MLRFPSWTWLALRTGPTPAADPPTSRAAGVRPCLPAVEKLDVRVLLSTAPTPAAVDTGGTTQVLIGLLGDGVNLTGSEYAALSTLPAVQDGSAFGAKHNEVASLGENFVKIDEILFEYGQDILQQKVTPTEMSDVGKKIDEAFAKIEMAAMVLDQFTDGALLPAVQKVRVAALGDGSVRVGLLGDLNNLQLSGLVGLVPSDDLKHYIKIGGEFIKIDQALIDQKVDVLMGSPILDQVKITMKKVDEEFVKIMLEDVLISSANQVPPDFLDSLQTEIDGLISGNPGSGGGGT